MSGRKPARYQGGNAHYAGFQHDTTIILQFRIKRQEKKQRFGPFQEGGFSSQT